MKKIEKSKAMDGVEYCNLKKMVIDILGLAFEQRMSWEDAPDRLKKIYQQFNDKISRVDFNELVESQLESIRDCSMQLIDDIEDVIKI